MRGWAKGRDERLDQVVRCGPLSLVFCCDHTTLVFTPVFLDVVLCDLLKPVNIFYYMMVWW